MTVLLDFLLKGLMDIDLKKKKKIPGKEYFYSKESLNFKFKLGKVSEKKAKGVQSKHREAPPPLHFSFFSWGTRRLSCFVLFYIRSAGTLHRNLRIFFPFLISVAFRCVLN